MNREGWEMLGLLALFWAAMFMAALLETAPD